MKKLLTLKHWQLFLLLFGIPFICQIVMTVLFITSRNPTAMLVILPLSMIIMMVLFFSWFYAMGANLHKKLPDSAPMNLTRFKILLFTPLVYILFMSVFIFNMISYSISGGQPNPAIFALIVPLHLFSMFCIFYCLYFTAKALKVVEVQRPVTFDDFIGEFF